MALEKVAVEVALEKIVEIPTGSVVLEGSLTERPGAPGVVVFAHGSGSSRHSPRNRFVAKRIQDSGLDTLLFDLLTPSEDEAYENRFDLRLLTSRLVSAVEWIKQRRIEDDPSIGLFGASTGATAALMAAAKLGPAVRTVVSRGGRPDLAMNILPCVRAETLLIVGGNDEPVLSWNREAYDRLTCAKELVVVQGATHLFEQAGALEKVADLAAEWFEQRLRPATATTG